jgi:hypothetical protein
VYAASRCRHKRVPATQHVRAAYLCSHLCNQEFAEITFQKACSTEAVPCCVAPPLQASYTFSLPYVSTVQTQGLSFPVHMWVDSKSQRMRVDVFGGMDSTITLQVRPAAAAAAAGVQGWVALLWMQSCDVDMLDTLAQDLCMVSHNKRHTLPSPYRSTAARAAAPDCVERANITCTRWQQMAQHQQWLTVECCSLPAGHLVPAVPAHQRDSVRHHQR